MVSNQYISIFFLCQKKRCLIVSRITHEKFGICMFINYVGILGRFLYLLFNFRKVPGIYFSFWFSRSKDVIEPLVMEQWFVNMEEMSQMGINVSVSGNIFNHILICLFLIQKHHHCLWLIYVHALKLIFKILL